MDDTKDVNDLFDKVCGFHEAKNYEKTIERCEKCIELNPKNANYLALYGFVLSDWAGIKQNEGLFKDAEILFKKAFKKYEEANEINSDDIGILYFWGYALHNLAEIKQDEDLQKNIKTFLDVSKDIDNINLDDLDPDDLDIYLIKGELHFILKQEENAKEYFAKYLQDSNNDILGVLTFLGKYTRKEILKTEILHSLIDYDNKNCDSSFFKEATKDLTEEQKKDLDKYKEAYILSVLIICQLHVKNEDERPVAYYTKKEIAEKMLFSKEESKFRLNAINYSNDPTEGMTLLNYLFGIECPKREDLNTEYGAFAGCFTFNYDSLNQFRLYGREDDTKEGTGLSVVFKSNFFSNKVKMTNTFEKEFDFRNKRSSKAGRNLEIRPLPLFRCIYVDPDTGLVESVGHKEKYIFYREYNEKNFKKYYKYIRKICNSVKENMAELKKLIESNELKPIVIGKLLVNLRYLTKHIAFKEEQECRILRICRFDDVYKVKVEPKNNRMYLEYLNVIDKEPKKENYIEKIYFGPKATDMELFQDFLYLNGLNIRCRKSTNPLA